MARGRVFVGTSGYAYKGWHDRFYPADLPRKDELSYYAGHFNCVEINASFYRLPTEKAVKAWATRTPKDFRFCMKVSRYITHQKRLIEPEVHVPRFMEPIRALGAKHGPLLLQLHPHMKPNLGRLDETLAAFARSAKGWPVAVEIRNAAWYGPELDALLDRHGASLVLHDMPASRNEKTNHAAPLVYIRFHGPKRDYGGHYSRKKMAYYADLLRPQLESGRDVWAFFNNDRDVGAIGNADELRELIEKVPGMKRSSTVSTEVIHSGERPNAGI